MCKIVDRKIYSKKSCWHSEEVYLKKLPTSERSFQGNLTDLTKVHRSKGRELFFVKNQPYKNNLDRLKTKIFIFYLRLYLTLPSNKQSICFN